jgi:hypothetical protein
VDRFSQTETGRPWNQGFTVGKEDLKNSICWDVLPCRFFRTYVSEEHVASILKVEKSASEEQR